MLDITVIISYTLKCLTVFVTSNKATEIALPTDKYMTLIPHKMEGGFSVTSHFLFCSLGNFEVARLHCQYVLRTIWRMFPKRNSAYLVYFIYA